jgi:hypothetical protein
MELTTLAIGVDLQLVPTADGGRQNPLRGGCAAENRFKYRPNWGLPGWAEGEQTAAPVLGFSRIDIHPGEAVRAVLVPLFPEHVPAWRDVGPADELRMYEGARICGRATVVWVEPATWFMPDDQQERFTQWLKPPISGDTLPDGP